MTKSRAAAVLLAVAALVAGALLGVSALPEDTSTAAPRPPVRYDALGDSYASGVGVPPYAACGRSKTGAYPLRVDGRMRIRLDDFVACGGATTASLESGGQLRALDARTDLVTLTVGGNDIGWAGGVAACLAGGDAQCAAAVEAATGDVAAELPGRLDDLYADIAARAPEATVLVTGYPRLFSPEHGPFLGASRAEQQALNEGAELLNRVVADAAAEHGFTFVDVTDRFAGHGVNAPEPWILGPFDPGAFHPTRQGYRAYAAAVTAAVRASALR